MPVQADEKTMAEPGEKIMEEVRGMKVHSGALDIIEPEDQDGAGRTGGSDGAENQHSRSDGAGNHQGGADRAEDTQSRACGAGDHHVRIDGTEDH